MHILYNQVRIIKTDSFAVVCDTHIPQAQCARELVCTPSPLDADRGTIFIQWSRIVRQVNTEPINCGSSGVYIIAHGASVLDASVACH
jgi:hypothetical protein